MLLHRNLNGSAAALLVLLLAALTAGWLFMAWQIHVRTDRAVAEGRKAAAEIWGARVSQESPSVRSAGDPATGVPLSSAKGSVNVSMDYRRRGLVFLTGFRSDFKMQYTFANTLGVASPMEFFFPLPKGGELFNDVVLTEDAPGHASKTIDARGIRWIGFLQPGEVKTLEVSYQTRGQDDFAYNLPKSPLMSEFLLTISVNRGADIDYPLATAAPTAREVSGDRTRLTWDFKNVISGFEVGVVLPEHADYAKDLVRINLFAPVMLLGALALLSTILYFRGRPPDVTALCLVATGFFIVFPLASYLVSFMGIGPAYALAAACGGGALMVFIARRFGPGSIPAAAFTLALFLGVFPLAAMADRYTGLLLTIGLFAVIVASMELYLSNRSAGVPDGTAAEGAWQ